MDKFGVSGMNKECITTEPREIKKIGIRYYEKFRANKSDNLDEIDKVLEHSFLKQTHTKNFFKCVNSISIK